MRLSELTLRNFRSCRDTIVTFQEDITVLVGENGSGKSNIIDAIRLATLPASGRHPNYFQAKRDLTRTTTEGEIISIRQRFSDLTEAEKSVFLTTITDDSEDLIYTTKYDTRPDLLRRFRLRNCLKKGGARVVRSPSRRIARCLPASVLA